MPRYPSEIVEQDKLKGYFTQALENFHLSRGERKALREVLGELAPTTEQRKALVGEAFDVARQQLARPGMTREQGLPMLDGLEFLVKALFPRSVPELSEAYFAPRQDCAERLTELFEQAMHSAEICVFTITDNAMTRSILKAHDRGLTVKVITDDDKAFDRGSDIEQLKDAGIDVRTDSDEDHMHHKFALFDRRLLVTGSYNWTRSAAERNRENIVLTDDQRLVSAFSGEFDRLWKDFAPDG